MPDRVVAYKLLAKLFQILSHPHRLRIIEELYGGAKDVSTLTALLDISQSSVSQHLNQLKMFPLVTEERQGKHVIYHLKQEKLSPWLLQGLDILSNEYRDNEQTIKMLESAKSHWINDKTLGGNN
jgi:DNA-binding transcriptional ArsR family regulator